MSEYQSLYINSQYTLVRRMASNVSPDVSATTDQQKSDKDKQFVIVTAGKAGVGKSTLINNFLELEGEAALKAKPGPKSVTRKVDYCDKEFKGVQVRVIDIPGLHAADSGDRTDTRDDILGDLKGVTEKGVDVVFYCINLLNRLENVDYENMGTLNTAFGSKIWEHVIFVFTRTDSVLHDGSNPEELVGEFIEELHKHLVNKIKVNVEIRSIYSFKTDTMDMLSKDAEINTFNGIVGIPVSKNPAIPENWRTTLLLQVIRKCRKENIPALLEMKFFDWDEFKKISAFVAASGVGGAALGTAAGASVGAVIGGALTAPIGGAGAVPTAAGGATVGACIGTIGGSVIAGFGAFATRVALIVSSRNKIEERARLKIKEMLEKEKKLA